MFQWSLRHGPRILFCAAVAILLLALLQVVDLIVSNLGARGTYVARLLDVLSRTWIAGLTHLVSGLSNAAVPFFCALVIQRIDLWIQRDGRAAAVGPAAAPSWLARQGARLLLALALLYFIAAALSLVDLVGQAGSLHQLVFTQGAWIGPLWSGSLLLFASLALDRLDRWLATVRPCSD